MGEILDLKTIHDYNTFLGLETLNPLVALVDFSKVKVLKHRCKCFGFYAIFLKEKIHGPLTYGRNRYDYQEGTLVFIAPGQVGGTSLARKMKEYTFFSYEVNEALHMSESERQTVLNCFAQIEEELRHTIDRHSRSIIVSNIEVLLNHCLRFYDRQFTTRKVINRVKDLLAGTNKTVSEIAYEVGFQYPHHLSRMFKKVAGCTPNEYRIRH